jgi:hypothetical protein
MKYLTTFLLNLDAVGGGLIYGAPAGMYISTWVGLKHKGGWMEKFINWLFQDDYHCQKSVIQQQDLVRKYYAPR